MILDLINKYKTNIGMISRFINKDKDLLKELTDMTVFLPDQSPINQRLYHVIRDITHNVFCESCGALAKFLLFSKGYQRHCNAVCAGQNVDVKTKRKITNLNIYGVEGTSQVKEIRDKQKQTCLEKYGFESPFQSEEIKNQIKQVIIEKYGVDNVSKSPEIKEKKKQTCLANYGVEKPLQNKEILEKTTQTNLERYGVENPFQVDEFKEKIKRTCLEVYGVEHPAQAQEIKEKVKHLFLEKYGVESPNMHDSVKENKKKTCLERYGVESFFQTEEFKEQTKRTCLEKHGVEFYSQTNIVREKSSKSRIALIEKNGGENPGSNRGNKGYYFSIKNNKKIYHASFPERSAYEILEKDKTVKSYDRCKFHIDYELDGEIHRYNPDIHVIYADGSQEIIEVKMLWEINKPINQAKFPAANEYCLANNLKFVVWDEKELKLYKWSNK
jgi:hypothetical protein